MGKVLSTLIGVMVVVFAASPTSAETLSLESLPAVVVKTVPESGAARVDPGLGEIKVTFSKDMLDGSWSWVQMSNESFPKLVGQPKYLQDKRTCVAKVELEPNKTYVVWLNSEQFHNFKDANGRPAVPYLVVFKTGEKR